MSDHDLSRYERQSRFAPLGDEGQQRLAAGQAVICGCGALGTVAAETLVRAGVGTVRILDRDFVELNNLQRQTLFDEDDVARRLPKAIAAAKKLRRVNSQVRIEPMVVDIAPGNVLELLGGHTTEARVIIDGTDNFETRLLLNDAALELGAPWIYAGCLGAEGQTMTIVPGQTGCLRCLLPEPPAPGTMPSCETAGVLGPIVNVIASIAACEAIKILSGRLSDVSPWLTVVDLWTNRIRQLDARALRHSTDCPACERRDFAWLRGERTGHSAVLCGRNAVQISPGADAPRIDLNALAERFASFGPVETNPYLVRLSVDDLQLTVFGDGRVIVGGTSDPAVARSAYARYVGL
jgi:adenylyltransferase/sulfurtransferase